MKTWMLIIFLAYSNGSAEEGGSVALQSEKVDFFSQEECRQAKRDIDNAIKGGGFRRSVTTCVARGVSLLERDPILQEDPAPLKK